MTGIAKYPLRKIDLDIESQGKETMEKHWKFAGSSTQFKTLDDCTEAAKRWTKQAGSDSVMVYEAVAVIKTPVPEYEVVKL